MISFKFIYRWISDQNRNQNKHAYFIELCYFYDIKIAKLYVISLLISDSISIGNPPDALCEKAICALYGIRFPKFIRNIVCNPYTYKVKW